MTTSSLVIALAALTTLAPLAPTAEPTRGAAVPWTTYEAEEATTSGSVLGPDYKDHSPAREASGRHCVSLAAAGAHVEFAAKSPAQGLVLRYSIPDSPDGRGIDATLSLYVNGELRRKLPLTSRYSHLYGPYPFSNEPALGSHRNFWDEVRVMPGDIRPGDVVRLQKDGDDTAAEYLIDFVDLEPVPAPLTQPENALSVLEFGAKPDDDEDDRAAFAATVDAAVQQKKIVWIPPGRFVLKGALRVSDVAIHGAGMWHSTLVGVDDYRPEHRVAIYGNGSNVTLADFAILGKLNYRNDSEPNDGIGESFGTGSTIRNVWIEHTKAGAWIVNSDGLLIEGCRFRNNIADGINLCVGMRNTIVRNCTARGTGDDCFAMWPATYAKASFTHGSNRFEQCTAQLPFLAQGFSIYGGEGNTVEDCVATDIPYGAGLFASTTFPTPSGFAGTTTYRRVRITRAGGSEGALATVANRTDLAGLRFEDIDIIDSPNDAVRFISVGGRALRDTILSRIHIRGAGVAGAGYGVVTADDAVGAATLQHVSIEGAKSGAFRNLSPSFEVTCGQGTADLQRSERNPVVPADQAKR